MSSDVFAIGRIRPPEDVASAFAIHKDLIINPYNLGQNIKALYRY